MKLIWHIVEKDLQRLALPVLLWVAFAIGTILWLRVASAPANVTHPQSIADWVRVTTTFAAILITIQAAMSYVLTGSLVLDDRLVGPDAFWKSRPISRGRLLAAKLTAAAVLFVVGPALALGVVWAAFGFSAAEVARAAGSYAWSQTVLVIVAMTVAALAGGRPSFFFGSIGLAIAYGAFTVLSLSAGSALPAADGVRQARELLLGAAVVPFFGAVLVHQFVTLRVRRGWVLVASGIVAACLIRLAWPWELGGGNRAAVGSGGAHAARGNGSVGVTFERIVASNADAAPLRVRVDAPARAGAFLAPRSGWGVVRWPDGVSATVAIERGVTWAEEAALRVFRGKSGHDAPRWDMALRMNSGTAERWAGEPVSFSGEVMLMAVRGRVLAELPLRPQEEASVGAHRMRVVGVQRRDTTVHVVIEEHDAASWAGGGRVMSHGELGNERRHTDAYLIANRALGWVQGPPTWQRGAVAANSLVTGFRELEISPPTRDVDGRREEIPDWEREAVLVKVRFEVERTFAQPVSFARLELSPNPTSP